MISDVNTLRWLQWKRFKGNAAYWLTLIGFEPGTNRFYLLYVALFWAFWLYIVWVFVVEQVYQISLNLSPTTVIQLRTSIPLLLFLLQLAYLALVLRDSPLQLGAAEIEYVAASPVNRGGIVVIHFIRSLLLPAFFAGIASCLLAMLLTWQAAPTVVGFAGLQALVLGIPVFLFSAASAWIVAILKLSLTSGTLRVAVWFALPAAAALAQAFPQVAFFPGALWLTTIDTGLTVTALVSVLMLLCLACGLLVMAGGQVNMAAVADGSRMYARIQKLGIFARLYANDVVFSVRRQSQLVRKKRLRLAMSERAAGYSVILNRALLSLFRLAPASMVRLVLRGVVLAGTVSLVVHLGKGQYLQTWVLLLMILIQFRPAELNMLFQQDVGQVFTRQFLPKNPLGIALADSIFPIALFSLGGLGTLLLQPWIDPLTAVVLVTAIAAGLEFCQALELVIIPRLFFRRIPYTYSLVFCGAALIAAGYLFKSLPGVALVAVIINLVLGTALYLSRL